MKSKAVSGIMLALFLMGTLTLAFNIQRVEASGTIYIRADGSVDPDTAPISSVDNVTYTFTGNITDSIVVERDNIVVDGAGYTLQGTGWGNGISLTGRINVTIRNIQIKAFYYGIYLDQSSDNTIYGNNLTKGGIYVGGWDANNNVISGNNITNNRDGNRDSIVLDVSSNTVVSGNNIVNSDGGITLWNYPENSIICGNNLINNTDGLYVGSCSGNTVVYHNNFINNTNQVTYHPFGLPVFDNGYPSGGNYWSDYTSKYPDAQELDGSGIWDTPYFIDENNQDNYPLMSIWGDVDLEPPVASFTYSPTVPFVKIPVLFDASASYDPDGFITWYEWDFGKGYLIGTPRASGSYQIYSNAGNYTVTLTVTDNEGLTDTETTTLTVRAPINPQEGEVTLNPIDDTYTNANNPDENYGDQTTLYVSNITEGIAWLKFDLGAVPDGAVVDDALLKLYCSQVASQPYDVCAHWCSDNSWTESTLTYSNMPSFNASQFIQFAYRFSYEGWGSGGVGDAVRRSVDGIHDGPDIVTIVISGTPDWDLSDPEYITFHSKESLYVPELTVHWIGTDTLEDTTPPTIGIPSRIPDGYIFPDQEVKVSVNVTDVESGVKNVTLSYTINEGATWTDVPMIKTTGNTYVGEIPELPAETSVQYKIIAYDNTGNFAVEDDAGQYYVHVAVQVGVKAGDWIKCDYTVTGWPSGTPRPEWMKVEILSVEETTATVRVTMHMSDGTEQSDTVNVDVATGNGTFQGLSGFVIPANSKTGDTIYMSGYGNVTLDGETTRTCAGASRTVVYASFSRYGTELTYYWDKETGVMVEASTTSGGITGTAKATETNMWEAVPSPFWMQWWFFAIVAVGIVALVGVVYFLKKRKPPTAPSLSTEQGEPLK